MVDTPSRWVARLIPSPGTDMETLLATPLGLDVWERHENELVVAADEAQLDRLEKMGYTIEQLRQTEASLSDFATDEAVSGYHSVTSLEQDMCDLAQRFPEIAALEEIGRSVENRPIWALRLGERSGSTTKIAFLGCDHAREWLAVEVPYLLAEHLVTNSSSAPVATDRDGGRIHPSRQRDSIYFRGEQSCSTRFHRRDTRSPLSLRSRIER